MIVGVRVPNLVCREDERGYLTEIASTSWAGVEPIVHVYEAVARPGVIKAFHAHLLQTDRFYCLDGACKVGLIDLRGPVYANCLGKSAPHYWRCHVGGTDGPTDFAAAYPTDREWMAALGISEESPTFMQMEHVVLSHNRPQLLFIPPGVAHGQMGLEGRGRILNMPTMVYNRKKPDEVRMPHDLMGFKWEIQSG